MPNANPAFEQAEYDARLAKTRTAMEAAGIELLIVSDPSNMAWLTGYDGWSFYVHQCVLLGLSDPPLWYGRMQDTEGAYRTVWMSDDRVLGYPDTYVQNPDAHPMEYLAAHLADHGRAKARIGVEMDNFWFTAKAYQSLAAGLPDAHIQDATGLVNWQRAVKSPQELSYMRTAARFTERIMERILERAEPGLRKCDLVADIYDASLRFHEAAGCGGDYPAIVPLLPSGSDAAAPHLTWDDRPLRTGEGTCFEVAGVHRRYHCPLARTLFLGTPTPEFLEAEKAVLEGLEAGLEQARPGNRCQDVAGAFFAVLARHGITKDSRTGYPIGLSYPPDWGERTMSLRPGDTTVLEPGMTFHFMTGLWQDGWGFELTESFAVTDSAPECLANVPRRLFVKP
ncbi:MAG: ectoine hydrolase DoeA [Pseudomonadota bacterium]